MKMVNQPNGAATSRNNSGQSKIIERMEDGMKNLTTIKTMEEAAILRYAEHMIQDMKLEKVGVVVTMNDGQAFLFPLMNAFQIHRCNEFLRSLNLGDVIEFQSYSQYSYQIAFSMKLLKIKRLMDAIGGADGVTTAVEVYEMLLDECQTSIIATFWKNPWMNLFHTSRKS